MDAFLALFADDIEMISDPEWPEPDVMTEVTARGWWDSRGAASGVTGELAFGLRFVIREGLIVRQEWSRA